ncbi:MULTISPECIES: hypothetical protein [Nostocales]|uniref:Uncharacterized protein n=3 Tax=Nostocales TaxID=1161 RepID=A0A8S9T1X4_9CYAN|nr:hypothetical protein [Tolypothrix bouteillei]KAF3886116.1 hypothetical protein DA73_0400012010 [Tolypothrix bouteillei VB521301]
MTIIDGYFDELEFWNSAYFGSPKIEDSTLIIPTREINIYARIGDCGF